MRNISFKVHCFNHNFKDAFHYVFFLFDLFVFFKIMHSSNQIYLENCALDFKKHNLNLFIYM